MAQAHTITRITVTHYAFQIADRGPEERLGLDTVYRPGVTVSSGGRLSPAGDAILTIETDAGVRGEVPGSVDAATAGYLLGRDASSARRIWHDLKRFYRGAGNAPPGAADVALWDIAGKLCGAAHRHAAGRLPEDAALLRQQHPRRRARWPDAPGGLRRVRPAVQGRVRLPRLQDPRLGDRPGGAGRRRGASPSARR